MLPNFNVVRKNVKKEFGLTWKDHEIICDPAMKQFLLHLDEKLALGRKFIIQDLDESHLFISTDIVETLQARVDELMDRISFPLHEKEA